MTTLTEPTTRTLEVPDATLTYDVRKGDSPAPILFIIGSPMGAGGFVTLASHFPDRTIATYDPRGVDRSTKVDPASDSTPEQHADDLHRIITELGVFDRDADGLTLIEIVDGVTVEQIEAATDAPFRVAEHLR